MGADNQPKHRQARKLARRRAVREPFDRILIVTEGTKTEPLYLDEVKHHFKLPSANVKTSPSDFGTDPLSVVEYAEHVFINGDEAKYIGARSFERVYAVFDRDEHGTYHNALSKADSLDKKLKNDAGTLISFQAAASVPNFELWILLHFEDVFAPIHRDEVMARIKASHIPDYEKAKPGLFELTLPQLSDAMQRAQALAEQTNRYDGNMPYTDIYWLVDLLIRLRDD